jgi:hypothetical protein
MSLEQYQLEASALYDPARQLYRHVNDFDPRSWGTGNGWMAMGMMRTLAATFAAGEAGVLWDRIGPMESEIAGVFASLFKQLDVSHICAVLSFGHLRLSRARTSSPTTCSRPTLN